MGAVQKYTLSDPQRTGECQSSNTGVLTENRNSQSSTTGPEQPTVTGRADPQKSQAVLQRVIQGSQNKGDPAIPCRPSIYTGFFPQLSSSSGVAQKFPASPQTLTTVHNSQELETELAQLKPGQLALVMFSADGCDPCRDYFPIFEKLALTKGYAGKFLIIYAEGINRSKKEWEKYGVTDFPTVAFVNEQGKATVVDDRNDPLASLAKTAINNDEDEFNYYLQLLEKPNLTLRAAAVEGIQKLIPKVSHPLPKLESLFNHKDPQVAHIAVGLYLVGGGEPKKTVPVFKRLLQENDPVWAGWALDNMELLGIDLNSVLSELENLLSHQDPRIVLKVAESILENKLQSRMLVPALAGLLRNQDPGVVQETVLLIDGALEENLFGSNLNSVLSELESLLSHQDPQVVLKVAQSILKNKLQSSKLVPALAGLLKNQDPSVIQGTLFLLGQVSAADVPNVVPLLERLLDDSNVQVICLTVIYLGKFKQLDRADLQVRVLSRLQYCLSSGNDPSTITEVAMAVMALGPRAASLVPQFNRLLNSKDPEKDQEIVEASIAALAFIGPASRPALPKIKGFLKSKNVDVVALAAQAVGQMGPLDEETIRQLTRLLGYNDFRIVKAALHSLGQAGPKAKGAIPEIIKLLDVEWEDEKVWHAMVQAAATSLLDIEEGSDRVVKALGKKLLQAGERLKFGGMPVVTPLDPNNPPTKWIAEILVSALEESKHPAAVLYLLDFLSLIYPKQTKEWQSPVFQSLKALIPTLEAWMPIANKGIHKIPQQDMQKWKRHPGRPHFQELFDNGLDEHRFLLNFFGDPDPDVEATAKQISDYFWLYRDYQNSLRSR